MPENMSIVYIILGVSILFKLQTSLLICASS